MKIHLVSDIHAECSGHEGRGSEYVAPPGLPEDAVVVAAGDIHDAARAPGWLRRTFGDRRIVYVTGNHELYGFEAKVALGDCRKKAEKHRIDHLDRGSLVIDGIRFLGCTLWTDFRLRGAQCVIDDMRAASRLMMDYRRVFKEGVVPIGPHDTFKWHIDDINWLASECLKQGDWTKTVIVTHHGPAKESCARDIDQFSSAFCSDLGEFVAACGAPFWFHGHTHSNVDYMLGATRVLTNQVGYPAEHMAAEYRPDLIIDI